MCLCWLCCGLATLAVLTSCGDDDSNEVTAQQIVVVKSDLLFEPVGRTGSVEVEAPGELTATLQADWCRATVEGKKVSVTVDDNKTFEGRTALLTISAGGSSITLPVQQRGMALGSLSREAQHVDNAATRLAYYIRHDLPFNLQTEEDWLHPRMEGDSLIIEVDRNADRYIRRGIINYDCAGYTGQLEISQYDISDILGEYYFGGNMSGASTGFRFILSEKDGSYYMTIHRLEEWANSLIPVDFDEDRCIIYFHSASEIYSNRSVTYAYYFYTTDGAVANSYSATMKARIYYNPFATSAGGSHYATLEDAGTWADGTLSGFLIYAISAFAQTPFIQLADPYLVYMGHAN